MFNQNGSVTVKNLENQICQALIAAIHGKENFGKKLFCNGIIPFSPNKDTVEASGEQSNLPSNPAVSHPSSSAATLSGCPTRPPATLVASQSSSQAAISSGCPTSPPATVNFVFSDSYFSLNIFSSSPEAQSRSSE